MCRRSLGRLPTMRCCATAVRRTDVHGSRLDCSTPIFPRVPVSKDAEPPLRSSAAGSGATSDSNESPPKNGTANGIASKSAVNGLKTEAQVDSGADSTDGCARTAAELLDLSSGGFSTSVP